MKFKAINRDEIILYRNKCAQMEIIRSDLNVWAFLEVPKAHHTTLTLMGTTGVNYAQPFPESAL